MLTTAGFTNFAISTKFFPSPPPIGNCGAVATGRTMGLGIGSGPAVPVGSQPMLEAMTTPITTTPVSKVNGSNHVRTSFIGEPCSSYPLPPVMDTYHTQPAYPGASLPLAAIDLHDCVEEFHRFRFRSLERVSPND